jgi:hypothetical protein
MSKLLSIHISIWPLADTARVTAICKATGAGGYQEHVLLENAPLDTPEASRDPWVLLASAYRALAAERALRVKHRVDGEG